MLYNQESKRITRRYLYFLLSLLAHVIIVVFVFLYKDDSSNKKRLMLNKTPVLKKEQPVVFFNDSIPEKNPVMPQEPDSLPQPESSLPATIKPRPALSSVMPLLHQDEVLSEPEKPVQDNPKSDIKLVDKVTNEKIEEITQDKNQEGEAQEVLEEQAPVHVFPELIKPTLIKAQQKMFAQENSAQEEFSILKKSQDKSAEEPKNQKKDLMSLMKNFAQGINDEGCFLSIQGDDSKTPTREELEYAQYVHRRFSLQLQQLLSYETQRTIESLMPALKAGFVVSYRDDEHGNILAVSIAQSSGSEKLDRMLLQAARNSSPLPPRPRG